MSDLDRQSLLELYGISLDDSPEKILRDYVLGSRALMSSLEGYVELLNSGYTDKETIDGLRTVSQRLTQFYKAIKVYTEDRDIPAK